MGVLEELKDWLVYDVASVILMVMFVGLPLFALAIAIIDPSPGVIGLSALLEFMWVYMIYMTIELNKLIREVDKRVEKLEKNTPGRAEVIREV